MALVSNATILTGSPASATGGSIVDFVGYGNADKYEGTAAGPAQNGAAAIARRSSGTADTDQNADDFQTQPATPHNSTFAAVVTAAATGLLPSAATSGGNVLATGTSATTGRGIVYSTTANPRIGASGSTNLPAGTAGTGSYASSIAGLTPGTTYYVVAYATNTSGTSYGTDETFTTLTGINFYAKATGTLDVLTTFGTNTDGSGTAPNSFADAGQVFNIVVNIGSTVRTIAADWTVAGTGSKVVLQNGAVFTVPAAFNFTGMLDLGSNSTLVQQNMTPAVNFGSVDATSTIEFAQAGTYTVPVMAAPGYGNLTLRNSTKLLSTGTTTVRGNLVVSNVGTAGSDVFGGSSASVSVLNLGGNFTLSGTVGFSSGASATDRIALVATNTGTAQVLDGGGNTIKLLRVTLPTGQAGLSLGNGTTNLELGNASGGGYQLATGTVLSVGDNTLSFPANSNATITSTTGNLGVLALSNSTNLSFSRIGSGVLGILRTLAGSSELNNLTVNATTGGTTAGLILGNDLTVSGTTTLTLGVLALDVNTLTVNGPLDAAGGTFRGSNDASLLIGGSGSLNTLDFVNTASARFLKNFTLNRAGQTLALGANDDLTVITAFVLTDGILDINGNKLTLNGSVTSTTTGLLNGSAASELAVGGSGTLATVRFTPGGGLLSTLALNRPGGTLAIEGASVQITRPTLTSGVLSLGAGVALNITNELVVTDPTVAQFAGTPTSTLTFSGQGLIGSLAFVAGQDQIASLTLNRGTTGSTASVAPTAQLTTNLTVNNLTLTRGRLFVHGAANLKVLPGGSALSGGPNGFTNKLTLASVTNITTPTVAISFPLGVNDQYRPLILTVTDQVIGTTSYTAQQFEAPSPVRTLPASLARVSQIRYYNVVRESGNSTLLSATVRLTYDPASDLTTSGINSLLRVAMTDPTDPTKWRDALGTGTGTNITSASFLAGPLGDFTLATDITTPTTTNPLPVELVRFDAKREAGGVRVTWATASEKNSARFDVQRSLDGREFGTVATATASGTTTQPTVYAALDKLAPASRLYYRLRQVDLDGTLAYSPVVTVAGTDTPAGELALFPNPTTDQLTATLPALAGRTYRVLNALGQVLDRGTADSANPAVDVRRLPAGTYFLELHSEAGQQVRRFVKND